MLRGWTARPHGMTDGPGQAVCARGMVRPASAINPSVAVASSGGVVGGRISPISRATSVQVASTTAEIAGVASGANSNGRRSEMARSHAVRRRVDRGEQDDHGAGELPERRGIDPFHHAVGRPHPRHRGDDVISDRHQIPVAGHARHRVLHRHEVLVGDQAGPEELVVQCVARQLPDRPRRAVGDDAHLSVVDRRHLPCSSFTAYTSVSNGSTAPPSCARRTLLAPTTADGRRSSPRPTDLTRVTVRACRADSLGAR